MSRERERSYATDRLETAMPAAMPMGVALNGFRPEVGLEDLLGEEARLFDELPDEDLNASDVDFELAGPIHEIPMSDILGLPAGLAAPEMSDNNLPGSIDIEELDEFALEFTNHPAGAMLDPLEE